MSFNEKEQRSWSRRSFGRMVPILAAFGVGQLGDAGAAAVADPAASIEKSVPSKKKDTYVLVNEAPLNVRNYGISLPGVDYSKQFQAALNDLQRPSHGAELYIPRPIGGGMYKASGLKVAGSFTIRGQGGGSLDTGLNQTATVLSPAVAGKAILTVRGGDRFTIEGVDFKHDRSFRADALVIDGGSARKSRWFTLRTGMAGFKGHGLRLSGTLWETDLSNVHMRQCGDGAHDKAAFEIDCRSPGVDADTLRLSSPFVIFPQGIGLRVRASNNAASPTEPGFRSLTISGGMFHAGTNEQNLRPYDADMIKVDGFSHLIIRDVNIAAVAASRYALTLDGTLNHGGSSQAYIDGNRLFGPIRILNAKDVTVGDNFWPFFTSSSFRSHISIGARAVRTRIMHQTVVNGGPLGVSDKGKATYRASS